MLEKYYISKKDNTDLNVYRCGFEECSPDYSWGPGVRDHYIIHLVLTGKGSYTVNGETYFLEAIKSIEDSMPIKDRFHCEDRLPIEDRLPVGAEQPGFNGRGFLICPEQIVSYKADTTDPWTYSWVGFHGIKAEQVLKKAGLSPDCPVFNYIESDNLTLSLNELIKEARDTHGSELMLTSLLYRFLACLVNRSQNRIQTGDKATDSARYVSKAVEYIDKNYSGTLSVNAIAQSLKIDRSYLSTLFSRYLGVTPREFIINYRMDKACELLKNPLLSVGDVARSVGYEDPFQFSKTFKKAKGVSPSQYRSSLLKDHSKGTL